MEEKKKNLQEMDILLCGLAITSRTETLEDYLKDKARSLTVIAISSCFLKDNLSSCRIYRKGALESTFRIPNLRIKDYKWFRQPLIILVFIANWLSICSCVMRIKTKYDLYIGISHSFGIFGAILKKAGKIKHLIYYCIDYYIPNSKFEFNTLFVNLINIIDCFTVKNADYIWDISQKIPDYREEIGKIKKGSYQNIFVPLGYSKHLRRFRPIEEIDRWDIGFVGTVTASQGMQLLVEAIPDLIKEFPLIKVKIIGHGPYSAQLQEMVSQKGLDNYFIFLGFIKENDKMLDMISRCAIGVALWNNSIDDKNIICADPGKTKLYALCGLPTISTKISYLSKEMQDRKAGIAIEYNINSLREAIIYLLSDDGRLKDYKLNAFNLGESYISDNIFNMAFVYF